MKLLRIDSSGRKESVSRQLTSEFVARWRKEHPGGEVTERDLSKEQFSAIGDEWIVANRIPVAQRTDLQRTALARSDLFIAELMAADIIVIGTPMHNFTTSWPLKAWIDQIVRVGTTIVYGEDRRPRGVLQGKRVVVISSRGGSYRAGSHRAQMDFLEPYLRAVFGYIGVTDITFIHVENQYRTEEAHAGKALASQQVLMAAAALATASAPVLSQ